MGNLTLLGTIQQVAGEIGLTQPQSAMSAQDLTTMQMVALATRAGQDLYNHGEWSYLQSELIVPIQAPVNATVSFTVGSTAATITSTPVPTIEPFITAVQSQYCTKTCRVQAVSGTQITLSEAATETGSDPLCYFSVDCFSVPADCGSFIARTSWDRSRLWELEGPISPQEDQWLESGIVAQGPRRKYRIVGRDSYRIVIRPSPTTSDLFPANLVFEYISNYWINDATGVSKAAFTADTDTTVFDDIVFTAGLKWRFLQAKGLEYQPYQAEWMSLTRTAFARANPGRTLNMVNRVWAQFVNTGSVPDGNWPGPVGGT